MYRKPVWIFLGVVTVLVFGALSFIQSAQFAGILKSAAQKYAPRNVGIDADFSGLSIHFFPPGISLNQAHVKTAEKNALDLPGGLTLDADQLTLSFLPVQLLARDILISKVTVSHGSIFIPLPKAKGKVPDKKKPTRVSWDELFKIRVDSIGLEDTEVRLRSEDPQLEFQGKAQEFTLKRWKENGLPGYEVFLNLNEIQGDIAKFLELPLRIDSVHGLARVNEKGVFLENFKIKSLKSEILATGNLEGNVLESPTLVSKLEVDGAGRIEDWSTYIPGWGNELTGSFHFKGQAGGDLKKLSTFRGKGTLGLSDVSFREWSVDTAEFVGSWDTRTEPGELKVEHALITKAARPRIPGVQAATGGKIEIGAFQWNLGSNEPVRIPIKLDHAHIQWLAASELKSFFALDTTASGAIDLKVFVPIKTKKADWWIQGDANIATDFISLDNQKLKEKRPLTTIFSTKNVGVKGGFRVTSKGFFSESLIASLPSHSMPVIGKIDFEKKQFDLKASGQINMNEVQMIANQKVAGDGSLAISVHGPMSDVTLDFDLDLKDAYFLSLYWGDLKGHIRYEDKKNLLSFENVQGKTGQSKYTGVGQIDLEGESQIDLRIKVLPGDVHDYIQLARELTDKISWFPKTLVGQSEGSVRVTGATDLAKLKIWANVTGKNWQYLGERFKSVIATGGFDQGSFILQDFQGRKSLGWVSASVSNSADEYLTWKITAESLSLTDFDLLRRLDVPVRGLFRAKSQGKGRFGAIESRTDAEIKDVLFRGQAYPDSEFHLTSQGGITRAQGVALGGQGDLNVVYDSREGGDSSIEMNMNRLDFSPILILINSSLMQDRSLKAYTTGKMNLRFKTGASIFANGNIDITEYRLEKNGSRFEIQQPRTIPVNQGNIQIEDLKLVGPESSLVLNLSGTPKGLKGKVSGALDLVMAEFFTPILQKTEGSAKVDLDLGGTYTAPLWSGSFRINHGSLYIPAMDGNLEALSGVAVLKQGLLEVRSIEGELTGSRVKGNGTIEFFADRMPKINLQVNLPGNRIQAFPFQYINAKGKVTISGDKIPYTIGGAVIVESGLMREKMLKQNQVQGVRSARYTPQSQSAQDSGNEMFKLDLLATANQGILIQNDLFDCEAKGQVRIVNTISVPRVLGWAEVVQGKMLFKDRIFQIQSARVDFDNPAVLNPKFNLTASTEVGSTKIQLFTTGTLDQFRVDLTSNPVLSESEIVNLLATGVTSTDAKKIRGGDSSLFDQREAASLLLHSLEFNQDVQKKTGLQIELDESSNQQMGTSIFRPRSETESASSPKIVVRRQIGKRLGVTFGSTVGVGTSSQREVNAEYKVTPGFSVIGVWDNQEGVTASESQTSYGLDLKLQKRFK